MPAEPGFPHAAAPAARRTSLRSSLLRTPAAAQLLAADAPLWLDTEPPATEPPAPRPLPRQAAARPAAVPPRLQARTEPQIDPLAPAMPWLVRHLGVAAAVEAAVGPLQGGTGLDLQRLLPLLRDLGVDLRSDDRPLQALGAQDCPAVLLLRSGDTCVLTGCEGPPGPQRRWQLVVPEPQPLAFSVAESELARELLGLALVVHRATPQPPRSDLRRRAEQQAGRAAPDVLPLAALAAAMQLRPVVRPPGRALLERLLSGPARLCGRAARLADLGPALASTLVPAWRRQGQALVQRLRPRLPRLQPPRQPLQPLQPAAEASATSGSAMRTRLGRLGQALAQRAGQGLQRIAGLLGWFRPDSLLGMLLLGARPFERLVRQPLLALCALLCHGLGLPLPTWAPLLGACGLQLAGLLVPGLARRAFPDEQAQAEAIVRREQRRRERALRERELALAEARAQAKARRRAAAMAPFAPVLPGAGTALRPAAAGGNVSRPA